MTKAKEEGFAPEERKSQMQINNCLNQEEEEKK